MSMVNFIIILKMIKLKLYFVALMCIVSAVYVFFGLAFYHTSASFEFCRFFRKIVLLSGSKLVIIACGRVTAGQLHILGGYTR